MTLCHGFTHERWPLQYLQRHELEAEEYPCPAYTPALLEAVASKARALVAFAVARGWAATIKVRRAALGIQAFGLDTSYVS